MDVEAYRSYCLSKEFTTESFPFGGDTLVFKVCGKMFALAGIDDFISVNLKCNPERAIELRASYMAILPGFHMNKTHWNTVKTHEDVNDKLFYELIDHSYNLVLSSVSKKVVEEYKLR
jgi:predicted DNA-binding protein (MmcQ/YjbR family)